MWASVQTVRGCPKHCSFCSVWRTDGQQPRQREVDAVFGEIVELRRRGFRFIALADDNFYPVSLADLARRGAAATRRGSHELEAIRAERFELMERLAQLPDDMVFYTQITMEAAEDPEFLEAMRNARGSGARSSASNRSPPKGSRTSTKASTRRRGSSSGCRHSSEHGIHVLGSFIFGLPSDRPETFEATAALAERAGVTFAQFVMLTPFPGTVDFEKWERGSGRARVDHRGVPITRHWLIPQANRPKVYSPPPRDARRTKSGERTQARLGPVLLAAAHLGAREGGPLAGRDARVRPDLEALSPHIYANTGIATDSARTANGRCASPGLRQRPAGDSSLPRRCGICRCPALRPSLESEDHVTAIVGRRA